MSLRPPGTEIDGFRLGEAIHIGGMAWIYRLVAEREELHVYILIWRGLVFYGDNPELFELLFSGK